MVHPDVFMDQHPPHRVAGDAVHPLLNGRHITRQIERTRHHIVEAEDCMDRGDLWVHVANPHQPVAFDAIPEVVLHAEMHGVGPHLPDAVEPLVAGAKRADPRHVANPQHRPHLRQLHRMLGIDRVDPHEAEAARADRLRAEPGQLDHGIADRMVVLSVLLAAEIGHRLAGRLPKPHPHRHRLLRRGHGGEELHVPLQLAAKVDQDASGVAFAGSQRAGRQRVGEHDLPWLGREQRDRVCDAFVALPENPRGGDVELRQRRGGRVARKGSDWRAGGWAGKGCCGGEHGR